MKEIIILIVLLLIGMGVFFAYQANQNYYLDNKPVACTTEAKICPDGTSVGRTGSNCEFAACPDYTVGWNTINNDEYGFFLKYPNDFFDPQQEPRLLIGDCDYDVFPGNCPDINNIVAQDMVAAGGDENAIKNNLSRPDYWDIKGQEQIINDNLYCLYSNGDAATGHAFNYYYYATVKNQKCFIIYIATSTVNCDFYLPLESGNTEQARNYEDCLVTNANQPKILNETFSTFKFIK